jgi:hypothetical protein
MTTVGLQKEEKKLLMGQLVGLAIVALLLLVWTVYIFIGVMRLNFEMMKKMFASDPETIVYVFVPFIFVLVWITPRAYKLWKDISSNTVKEGMGEVVKISRSWISRDWLMTLNEPGMEKIKVLRKDAFKLIAGKRIKFRIVPSTRLLVSYEILNKSEQIKNQLKHRQN